jgi:hypothetical protein
MMKKIVFLASCFGLLLFFTHTDCGAFRCGDGFVSIGDSKTKVMLECGKPTSKEKGGVKKGVGESTTKETKGKKDKLSKKDKDKKDKKEKKETRAAVRGEYEEVSKKPIEKWYYNCGDNDFIYVLTFEGGKLKKEETEGYGKGKSDCKGGK